MKQYLRYLPPVHELQKEERFTSLMKVNGIDSIHMTELLKKELDQIREDILFDKWKGAEPGSAAFIHELFLKVEESVQNKFTYTLQRVINATGTILHTNLGRARLSEEAAQHMVEMAVNYSNLEYKIQEGERGSRHSHVEKMLKELTGAEAAMVVNNNAAAVYFILKALADKQEVIVSRGQLVEIGGSFRISSIMEESGAVLVEVGTTNKTHAEDYERAITENTAMILKVHTSNFKVIGFTKTVETAQLSQLSAENGVIFYEDLGSGALYDFRKHGIGDEPVVSEVIASGADLVSFSGDKLLGGPQAGIIAGKKTYIEALKKHQLARVLRVDKMTLAALEGTLLQYMKGEEAILDIPVIRDVLLTKNELQARTEVFLERLQTLSQQFQCTLEDSIGQVGGGTMPDVEIQTVVASLKHKSITAEEMARRLRMDCKPSIIVRIRKEEILIDLRTITSEEEEYVLHALAKL